VADGRPQCNFSHLKAHDEQLVRPASDWTPQELAATVAAYLRMLTMELTGQAYNKSEHRRVLHLLPVLSQRDYLAREARSQSLGRAGEEFVVHYERWRLIQSGHERLADRIEHTANERGDGAGYDVLSFEVDGRERFIEVKTTAYAKDTPFFISDGELSFANSHELEFRLYRVFEFRRLPRLFELRGRPDGHCRLDPITFRASFS